MEELIDIASKNADIIITASRSKGAPAAKVNEYAQKFGIEIEWYKKSVEYYLSKETQDFCNREYGLRIFNEI